MSCKGNLGLGIADVANFFKAFLSEVPGFVDAAHFGVLALRCIDLEAFMQPVPYELATWKCP